MTLRLICVTALMLMAIPIAPSMAAADTTAPLGIEEVNLEGYPEVEVTISVPAALTGVDLDPTQFRVSENDQPVPGTVQPLARDELEVVLVLDASGSMSGEPMSSAQAAVATFVEQMPDGVRVAAISFGTSTTVLSEFTTDLDQVVIAVSGVRARGETALYDALIAAAGQFSELPGARRSVVVLTDGGDTASSGTVEEAAGVLVEAGVDFVSVELQSPENDRAALDQLAAATGGRVVGANDPAALEGIFDDIASKLVNRYQLTYTTEQAGRVELIVTVKSAGILAIARQPVDYPPPAPPPPGPTTPVDEPLPVTTPTTVPAPLRPGFIVTLGWLATRPAMYLGLALIGLAAFGAFQAIQTKDDTVSITEEQSWRDRFRKRTPVQGIAERATLFVERSLDRGGAGRRFTAYLERAGLKLRPGEFLLLMVSLVVTAYVGGQFVGGPPVGVGAAAGAVILGLMVVSSRTSKRLAAFADQLPDALQLMAGSLRAGHGLMQAMDAVGDEADPPMSEEFHRVRVETQVGRDVNDALRALADRLRNEDFEWVVEAVEVHREVGGDLAEILEGVGKTIRERNEIRRQITALSAEGRLSAVVLIALPFFLGFVSWLLNPGYLAELTGNTLGWVFIVGGVALMAVGIVWIRRIIRLIY